MTCQGLAWGPQPALRGEQEQGRTKRRRSLDAAVALNLPERMSFPSIDRLTSERH